MDGDCAGLALARICMFQQIDAPDRWNLASDADVDVDVDVDVDAARPGARRHGHAHGLPDRAVEGEARPDVLERWLIEAAQEAYDNAEEQLPRPGSERHAAR